MPAHAPSVPEVRVSSSGARRIRAGHPWVFRVDVADPPELPPGTVVRVRDERGNFLARAFLAVRSPIALRVLTRDDVPCDREFLAARLDRALAFRRLVAPGAEAYRAVHGEADLLPGFFADVYGDALAVQATSEGADAWTDVLVDLLAERLTPRVVVRANDTSARDFEGLPRDRAVLRGGPDALAAWREGASTFEVDLLADLKTGAFLDQRENHAVAARYCPEGGRALDAFSYHGGFALPLAERGAEVMAVESDPRAAGRLRENVARNGRAVEVREENAFDVLRALEREGRRFHLVVLDPPALAKRKSDVEGATRAYKELNLRALRLLEPGGVLFTCSCSGRMTAERFDAVLAAAVTDARRPAQEVDRRGPAPDHPALLGVPETAYLKCRVLRVLER